MGVRNIFSYVSANIQAKEVRIPLSSNRVVLIDWSAFGFWFARKFVDGTNNAQRYVNSNYDDLCTQIIVFLVSLEYVGLIPVLIADGKPATSTRSDFDARVPVWTSRRAQRAQEVRDFVAAVNESYPGPLYAKGPPFVPKLLAVWRRTLRLHGFPILQCTGEADTMIRILSQSSKIAFLLTNDSDFLVSKGVPVCPLHSCSEHTSTLWQWIFANVRLRFIDKKSVPREIVLQILDSQIIADSLEIDLLDMVLLPLLLGNDTFPPVYPNVEAALRLIKIKPKNNAVTIGEGALLTIPYSNAIHSCFGWKAKTQIEAAALEYGYLPCSDSEYDRYSQRMEKHIFGQIALRNLVKHHSTVIPSSILFKFARFKEISALDDLSFCVKAQEQDYPSIALSIIGNIKVNLLDIDISRWNFRMNEPRGPCSTSSYLRSKMYGFILRNSECAVEEWWGNTESGSFKQYITPISHRGSRPLRKFTEMSDENRLRHYLVTMLNTDYCPPRKHFPRFGGLISSSLAAFLSEYGPNFEESRAIVLSTIIRIVMKTKKLHELDNGIQRLDSQLDSPLNESFTLSRAGILMQEADYAALTPPNHICKQIKTIFESLFGSDACSYDSIIKNKPLEPHVLFAWPTLQEIFTILLDSSLMHLLSQNSPISAQLYFCMQLAQMLAKPEDLLCNNEMRDYAEKLQNDKWFNDLVEDLYDFGNRISGRKQEEMIPL